MKFSLILAVSLTVAAADLNPRTERAYDAYLTEAQREMAEAPLRLKPLPGQPPRVASWRKDSTTDVHDGLIHDWVGAVYVPGVSAAEAVALLTDFDRHKTIYSPEVIDSKLLSREGATSRSTLRLVKKKVIAAVLDTEYETTYRRIDNGRWLGVIRSTRIQEVSNAGEPDEYLKPVGAGHGFLWRLNSWWVIEEQNGGVLLQLRSSSLSRDIPFGLSWMVKPMVTSLPRESVASTLEKTAAALRKK